MYKYFLTIIHNLPDTKCLYAAQASEISLKLRKSTSKSVAGVGALSTKVWLICWYRG
jgi:hypothetical protein